MKSIEELIEDYIDQVLTEEDQLIFDDLLERDPNFKRELELRLELHKLLARRLDPNNDELRFSIQEAENSYKKEGKKDTIILPLIKWFIPVIAAASLIFVGRFFYYTQFPSIELPEMTSETVRGNQNLTNDHYEKAVVYFNNKEYKNSSIHLKKLVDSIPTNVVYNYYYGLSLLGEQNYGEALGFLLVIGDGTSVFANEANYYAAAAYFKLEDMVNAQARINKIQETSKVYKKGQELLRKIE
ncbi:hypothetical protein [Sphingobacterium humi]|uniref:Tetratricopeptide repeat protein n=1 Tax=Sphingobacterium humi TaxID=1796905 RepID=A0A6N8L3L0_9SPHI|nr:hypothetical protein [Sphingobacterium humi]MVZ63877.1 hypothetical protein [Sphingobacterium humi]